MMNRIGSALSLMATIAIVLFAFTYLALPVSGEGVLYDGNSNPAMWCASTADNTTPLMCRANPTTKGLVLGGPRTVEAEGVGYSVDQTTKVATARLRIYGANWRATTGTLTGAIRGTPGGTAGAYICTGNVYTYFSVATGDKSVVPVTFPGGLDASSGICVDVVTGTGDFSIYAAVE